ncbi:hypothetical protein VPH35_081223 [Triticum aestivum]
MHPTPVPVFFLELVFLVMALAPAVGGTTSLALPGCPEKCGDVLIPYPFGIGAQCASVSLNSFFNLDCKNASYPPRPTVGGPAGMAVDVVDISLERGEMRVLFPISYICFTSTTNNGTVWFNLQDTPFIPSPGRNHFTVIGCNTLGLVGGFFGNNSMYLAGCYSYCDGASGASQDGSPCTGTGCCEVSILTNLTAIGLAFSTNSSSVWGFNPCFYAMTLSESLGSSTRGRRMVHLSS